MSNMLRVDGMGFIRPDYSIRGSVAAAEGQLDDLLATATDLFDNTLYPYRDIDTGGKVRKGGIYRDWLKVGQVRNEVERALRDTILGKFGVSLSDDDVELIEAFLMNQFPKQTTESGRFDPGEPLPQEVGLDTEAAPGTPVNQQAEIEIGKQDKAKVRVSGATMQLIIDKMREIADTYARMFDRSSVVDNSVLFAALDELSINRDELDRDQAEELADMEAELEPQWKD